MGGRGSHQDQSDGADLDNIPEYQDESDDPPETDGLTEKEDPGVHSEIRIESILSPTAEIFYPHVMLPITSCRELEEIGIRHTENLQEVTPGDEGIPVRNEIAALAEKAKCGRPKKGARVPERRSERMRKGPN